MVETSKVAEAIIESTAEWPSSAAIRELVREYQSQGSQERRVVILLDILDCLRQDMDAASGESTKLKILIAKMSASRWRYLGTPKQRGCAHLEGTKNAGGSSGKRAAADLNGHALASNL